MPSGLTVSGVMPAGVGTSGCLNASATATSIEVPFWRAFMTDDKATKISVGFCPWDARAGIA
jgi:hypothetical protein